jgi:phenylpropionate dioxygenase-like ring-hydroxylating dioxygenase large terminal subunit
VSLTRFFHPVAPSRAVGRKPVRIMLDGEAFVLFRDGEGRACALVDQCPHRFAPLSAGRVRADGRLACAYHGWHFDGEGHGVSPSQPTLTKCDAVAMTTVERLGYVWMAAKSTARDRLPRWDFERSYDFCGSFGVRFDAPLHVVLDNFSEDEHTPFVHTRLGWDERAAGYIGFYAENHDDHTQVHYDAPQRPTRVGRLFGLRPGDVFHNDWVTRFDPVCTVYETKWVNPKNDETRPLRITSPIFFVPETRGTTMVHTFVFARIGPPYTRFLPILKHVATAVAWGEIRDDARFIPTVAGTPASTVGMRLGRFDKPLVHNHRLLERLYYAADATVANAHDDGRLAVLDRT